ncbi:cytochrome c biogenesis protein CcsA [Anaeromyxobacter sp. Fw109-5]|uniref:cytochrome c biogenesis protein CcsA n=1 Tax=Anaeromyxobacter sp. (strain Fw109-5) TaxID=404589 RepID=UPI0000ED79FF|nr:cytochrome c biogenesis protein CcsA [Anaeromyxobacter sp. Fw109-5]ABS26948.1 cytochrome c assembly protein [Anaeromyxobacter sp. Fw109-5]
MKRLLNQLASLKLAVILLVLLLVGLAAGTIIESSRGAPVAQQTVYYAWWFLALQGLFAVNVTASILSLAPWGKNRIGYVLTHASMIVIFIGAGLTYFLKTEGQLGLWEGNSGGEIAVFDEAGQPGAPHKLPFTVKLDDFEVENYPGTMRPSQFRSRVQVTDGETGETFATEIYMNHPLHYRGYSLFQSSYQQDRDPQTNEIRREATILSVSKDPGQTIVFVGYTFLVLGMIVVLGTRMVEARKRAELERMLDGGEAGGPRPAGRAGKAAAAVALALFAGVASAQAPAALDGWAKVDAMRRLPVQHDGRSMPLDTLAREAVWNVTGKYSWNGEDPVVTVAQWLFDPMRASNTPLVELGSPELAVAVGLPSGTKYASFSQLVSSQRVLGLMQQARQAAAQDRPRTGVLSEAEKLEGRLVWMQGFLEREKLRAIPVAGQPRARWGVPQPMGSVDDLVALSTGPRLEGWPSPAAIDREILYKKVRATRVAWIVLLGALVLSLVAWSRRSRLLDVLAFAGLLGGFGVMSWGIAMRWAVAGRIPASNMYESLLFLAWGVGLFAVVALPVLRNRLVVLNANAMAALTMALTDLLPIDRFIHPMPPVLSGTPWLAIHVPIIMVGYSVLALGVVIAHMQIGFTMFAPRRTDLTNRMADLNYWYMLVGNILLIAGILTGSIWAASSWGRYWGWDPKEVWSLVAFLAYMAIVHGRFDKLIGQFGVAALSIVAFQTILMTYLGVNYVLGTGLHSYGMGDSPVVKWMILVALAEAAFVGWGWYAHARQQREAAVA